MTPALLAAAPSTLTVRPWTDPVVETVGLDPRSAYVERFWLPVLGPSTIWLLRRFVDRFDTEPTGFELDIAECAGSLGIGTHGGRNSTILRTIVRCCQFHIAHHDEHDSTLHVRRRIPPLNRSQLTRLPLVLQAEHARWQEDECRRPDTDALRARARQLALSLCELGEDAEAAERQLARWRFHPTICRDAAAWAVARHREAHAAALEQANPEPEPTWPPATEPTSTTTPSGD